MAARTHNHHRIIGVVLASVGFVLSPLSWWDDIVINIPVAYIFSAPFGLISKSLFLPAFIVAYWIEDVVGVVLLHHGVVLMAKKAHHVKSVKEEVVQSLPFTVVYTIIMALLAKYGVLKVPWEYFVK